jgi:hypothetical protein
VVLLAYKTYFKAHLMRKQLVVMVLVQYIQCSVFWMNLVNIFAGLHVISCNAKQYGRMIMIIICGSTII